MTDTNYTRREDAVPDVWTVGHSTRDLETFLDLLRTHRIEGLADVRRYPGSRRFPHFGRDALSAALEEAGIAYRHMPALGGRRKPRPDSPNSVWRNESFRGYADYMETAEFAEAMAELLDWARERRVAVMCSEAVWWRCHRSLISDYLKSVGAGVWHIRDGQEPEEHPFTAAARIEGGRLTYRPPDEDRQMALE